LSDPQQTNRGKEPPAPPERQRYLMFFVAVRCCRRLPDLFTWRFGTFYKGEQGDLRMLYGGVAMEPLYAAIGILAFVAARLAPRC
jgi:hypothetical protein